MDVKQRGRTVAYPKVTADSCSKAAGLAKKSSMGNAADRSSLLWKVQCAGSVGGVRLRARKNGDRVVVGQLQHSLRRLDTSIEGVCAEESCDMVIMLYAATFAFSHDEGNEYGVQIVPFWQFKFKCVVLDVRESGVCR